MMSRVVNVASDVSRGARFLGGQALRAGKLLCRFRG